MICPACKTKNEDHDPEFCVQCGSDLNVHKLLSEIRMGIQMNNQDLKEPKGTKSFNFFMIMQIIPSILFLICTIFGIFVGMQFLDFLKRVDLENNFRSTKSEISFELCQQMNFIIQKQLDLILDQKRENQVLQTKIQELTKNAAISDQLSSPDKKENL